MLKPAQLEVFEVGSAPLGPEPDGPSEDWQNGHAAGFEEARVLIEADANALGSELVQTLSDMSFGIAEARAEIMSQLAPLFDVLISKFLPDFAAQTLVPLVRERMLSVAAEALERPLTLRVAPDQIVAVSDALAETPHLPFTALSDPTLGAGQALISAPGHEEMVDLGAILALAQETLAALTDTLQERSHNG